MSPSATFSLMPALATEDPVSKRRRKKKRKKKKRKAKVEGSAPSMSHAKKVNTAKSG